MVSRDHFGFACVIIVLGVSLAVFFGACGGTSGALPDAGVEPVTAHLVILDPPGDIVGLGYGTSVTLRVRYETDQAEPLAGAEVGFQLVSTDDKSTGGATLSGLTAVTDATGVARMNLVAGAADASFTVRVTAPDARAITFVANVSAGGFADLSITPEHSGWRSPDSFDRVEVRLYRAQDMRCDSLDPDAPPSSLFPPRSMAMFGGVAEFRNLRAEAPYTIVSWAVGGASALNLAVGCIDIAAEQIPASPAALSILVSDREAVAPAGAALESAFDVSPLATALAQAGMERWWSVLACPAGPGQLVLDCALDVLADDGALNCVVDDANATVSATTTAIAARRGEMVDGCRPKTLPDSSATLDALLTAAIDTASFPTGAGLEALLTGRSNTLDLFGMRSELRFASGTASHRIVSANFDIAGINYTIELGPTPRPILVDPDVLTTMSLGEGLAITQHAFTLRYGTLAMAAFRDVSLASVGLDASAHDLGAALVNAIADSGMTGCDAASELVCTAAGVPAACMASACVTATAVISEGLNSWWRYLDGPDLDFTLAGTAALLDSDDDLTIDGFGIDSTGTRTGVWTATMGLSDSSTVQVDGAFGSTALLDSQP